MRTSDIPGNHAGPPLLALFPVCAAQEGDPVHPVASLWPVHDSCGEEGTLLGKGGAVADLLQPRDGTPLKPFVFLSLAGAIDRSPDGQPDRFVVRAIRLEHGRALKDGEPFHDGCVECLGELHELIGVLHAEAVLLCGVALELGEAGSEGREQAQDLRRRSGGTARWETDSTVLGSSMTSGWATLLVMVLPWTLSVVLFPLCQLLRVCILCHSHI